VALSPPARFRQIGRKAYVYLFFLLHSDAAYVHCRLSGSVGFIGFYVRNFTHGRLKLRPVAAQGVFF
jgi:hypothetical protein